MDQTYKNPLVTVDIILEIDDKIILIRRQNPPYGWALPGGFVNYGESLESAAVREAKEETSLEVVLVDQFHTYSDPGRDPRHHTITTIFIGKGIGVPKPADDAKQLGMFSIHDLPDPIVFDHKNIINDYFRFKGGESKKDVFSMV